MGLAIGRGRAKPLGSYVSPTATQTSPGVLPSSLIELGSSLDVQD